MDIQIIACDGRRDRFDIQVDGCDWRQVHTSIFGKRPPFTLKTYQTLSEWEEQFFLLEFQGAKRYALRQLARKAQTSMELAQSLDERLVSEEIIAKVVDEFSKLGYFDDSDWIQRYIKAKMARGKGPDAIKVSLRTKGIPGAMIEQELKAVGASSAQDDQIRRLLATRYKERNLQDFKDRQKIVGSLMRRGFDLEHIQQVLEECRSAGVGSHFD